jgi:hypothetical protein
MAIELAMTGTYRCTADMAPASQAGEPEILVTT